MVGVLVSEKLKSWPPDQRRAVQQHQAASNGWQAGQSLESNSVLTGWQIQKAWSKKYWNSIQSYRLLPTRGESPSGFRA